MRLDDVSFVRRKVVAVFAFGRENVEVVKPEIVHHLLELPLAVNRPRHLGHAQFRHHALRPFAVLANRARNVVGVATTQNVAPAGSIRRRLQRRLLFHRSRRVGIVWPGLRRGNWSGGRSFCIGRLPWRRLHIFLYDRGGRVGTTLLLLRACLRLLLSLLFRLLGLRVFIYQFCGGHVQRRIVLEASFHGLVIDGVGIELLLDPLGESHLAHVLDVARTRSIGEAV